MTRRGTFVYYLAAVVVGGLFLVIPYYFYFLQQDLLMREHLFREFFVMYFYFELMGFFALLCFAFLIRRLTQAFRWARLWQWCFLAVPVFLIVVLVLGTLGNFVDRHTQSRGWLAAFILLGGPSLSLKEPLWLVVLPGIALAAVLQRIHRAYEPQQKSS